jgi:hypothetical protein
MRFCIEVWWAGTTIVSCPCSRRRALPGGANRPTAQGRSSAAAANSAHAGAPNTRTTLGSIFRYWVPKELATPLPVPRSTMAGELPRRLALLQPDVHIGEEQVPPIHLGKLKKLVQASPGVHCRHSRTVVAVGEPGSASSDIVSTRSRLCPTTISPPVGKSGKAVDPAGRHRPLDAAKPPSPAASLARAQHPTDSP